MKKTTIFVFTLLISINVLAQKKKKKSEKTHMSKVTLEYQNGEEKDYYIQFKNNKLVTKGMDLLVTEEENGEPERLNIRTANVIGVIVDDTTYYGFLFFADAKPMKRIAYDPPYEAFLYSSSYQRGAIGGGYYDSDKYILYLRENKGEMKSFGFNFKKFLVKKFGHCESAKMALKTKGRISWGPYIQKVITTYNKDCKK